MPRRDDLSSILVIGSGPIVIGQACEFDYSGTQACRVLREERYRVVLANSNPATIMTDPDFADRDVHRAADARRAGEDHRAGTARRRAPDARRADGLNVAMALHERGVIGGPRDPELIGASAEAIATAEDRQQFKEAMVGIGLDVPASGIAHTVEQARAVLDEVALPVIIRPAYILGGRGTGIAHNVDEFVRLAAAGLAASPIGEILIEESIAGWKEFELEVMRDRADNCIVVCSIENVDPMGVHTGDSITVAPAQTLTDVEYQRMRDDAFACIRRVGVETGGSNVQFALDPVTGRQVIIEMNPRVSRSSALASKATGFPIAKIAARLAVGYTLDEITNDVTRATPACFEPVIDYVVTKIPRWAFEKLPGTSGVLGTQMQSVGEAMAIGRTFPESLQKALRSLEHGRLGLNCDPAERQLVRPRRGGAAGGGRHPDAGPPLPDRRAAAARYRPSSASTRRAASTCGSSTSCWPSSSSATRSPRWTVPPPWTPVRGGGPSASGSATPSWPTCGMPARALCAMPGGRLACTRRTRPSTRAPPSSPLRPRTTTRPGRTRARSGRRTGHVS